MPCRIIHEFDVQILLTVTIKHNIVSIQNKLKRCGYYSESIDGIYGSQTLVTGDITKT